MSNSTVAITPEQVSKLVAELERRHQSARDYVLPADAVALAEREEPNSGIVASFLEFEDLDRNIATPVRFPLKRQAHQQLASRCDIPWGYYERCLKAERGLIAPQVNAWLPKSGNERLTVRTLDGEVRAILSGKYRVLDNFDLFFNSYRAVKSAGTPVEVQKAVLTDDRLELRFVAPDWREEFGYDEGWGKSFGHIGEGGAGYKHLKGSSVIPGCSITNSETGRGGLALRLFIFDSVCNNTVLFDTELAKIHLGRQKELGLLSREAVQLDSQLVWQQVKDVTTAVFGDREKFKALVADFRASGELKLADPEFTVETVVKDFGFSDEDRAAILQELISPSHDRDPGRTVLGIVQAVTQRGQAYDDPDRALDFEVAGGRILARARELAVVRR